MRWGLALAFALQAAVGAARAQTVQVLHAFESMGEPRGPLAQGPDGSYYGVTRYGGANLAGTVFKISPDGSTRTTLYTFGSGLDGGIPLRAPILGSDGALYGATASSVYRLTTDGTFTLLRFLVYTTDGNGSSSLVQGSDGALYGTTIGGGPGGGGTAFRITTDGSSFSVLHAFTGTDQPLGGLIQASNGLLYGTTVGGAIFRMATDGSGFAVLSVVSGGASLQSPLLQHSDGFLYGITNWYAPAVFRMAPDGSAFSVVRTFAGDGAWPEQAGLVEGADHALYGTTSTGGTNDLGVVFRLATDGSYSILGSFGNALGGNPKDGVMVGSDGLLHGISRSGTFDAEGGKVFSVSPDGASFSMLASLDPPSSPQGRLALGSDGRLHGTTAYGGASGFGTVFALATDGTGFGVAHSFDGTDGKKPASGPIVGNDGSLYGVAATYPDSGGSIYRLTLDGSAFSVLHDFATDYGYDLPAGGLVQAPSGTFLGASFASGLYRMAADGSGFSGIPVAAYSPSAALVRGSDGAFYGTGFPDSILRVEADGSSASVVRTLAPAEGQYPFGLMRGADGNLYGTTATAGPNGSGSLYRLGPGGAFTVLYGFPAGTGAQVNGPPIQGSDGLLYGTFASGGTYGAGAIFRVKTDGTGFSILADFDYSNGAQPGVGLVQGPDGAFYGATTKGGPGGGGTVFRFLLPITALDQSLAVDQGLSLPITLTATPGASPIASYQIVAGPAHGTLTGAPPLVTYTPGNGHAGADSFTFTATDQNGAVSNVATIQVDVHNLGPSAGDQSVSTNQNTAKTITLAASDPGHDGLTYAVLSAPGHGTLSGTAPSLTYTPAQNYKGPDSFTFQATDSHGAASSPATVSITVVQTIPEISISDASVSEANSGTTALVFTLSLDIASASSVKVRYATAPGTATANVDYTTASGMLTFAPGVTSRTISVAVLGDTLQEPNETLFVNLTTPVAALVARSQAVGTIVDDGDVNPSVSVGNASALEGPAGNTKVFHLPVSLSSAVSAPVSVAFTTQAGTATVKTDFTSRTGTLTIPAGATAGVIGITVIGDDSFEPDETFVVTLANPVNASLGNSTATAVILNDDLQPAVSVGDLGVEAPFPGETVTTTFNVTLTNPSSQTVSVPYATVDGSAAAPAAYVARSGTLSFAPGVVKLPVVVTVKGGASGPDTSFFLSLGAPTNASLGDGLGECIVGRP
jgi:uncharacterized repeat protein (TIGR03803 family)